MKFSSLCLLAFERPDFLERTLASLTSRTTAPYELIVCNDGSLDGKVAEVISRYKKYISLVIENCGQNMGVGASMRRCTRVASGDYIFKVDADLEFHYHWLEQSVSILEKNPDVAIVGQFDYRNYAPQDSRFNRIEEREDCAIVDDFVNSIYGFRKETFATVGHLMGDDGWQQTVSRVEMRKLAITKSDVVYNFGFGLAKSIYMNPDGSPRKVAPLPKVINYAQS